MGRRHPARLQAWRTLGRLRDTAFTAPQYILDEEVTERALCLRCTRGEPARGRLPELGMVCIRHRQWLGSPQADLHNYRPALIAERQFRHHLAARNVLRPIDDKHVTVALTAYNDEQSIGDLLVGLAMWQAA